MIIKNQTVYLVVEAFKPYRYRIAKCKVRKIPYGKFKEYELNENGRLYWANRNRIDELYSQAVERADRMSNEYDKRWERLTGDKIPREWEYDK